MSLNPNYRLYAWHSGEFRATDNIAQLAAQMPFLSGNGANMWATQGYYFWTNEYDATQWNRHRYDIVVAKYIIEFKDETHLYDLVGNALHIRHFLSLLDILTQYFPKDAPRYTVHGVLAFLKDNPELWHDVFHSVAVKLGDKHTSRIPFVTSRREYFQAAERHQICIFASCPKAIFPKWTLQSINTYERF